MTEQANRYLGEQPVGRLLLRFAIPCILSLLVSSLYNIVDQIFIGWGVGYLGNGATNVVFPITVIALALALMIGDGCAARLSLCQGRQDMEGARRCVGSAVTLAVLCGVALTVVFALFREPILWGFGATENNIGYARGYFRYIVAGIPFFVFANALNSIIRADGSPKFAMAATVTGCIINVILDPVAIFVLHWGVEGAALATVAGQVVSALLSLFYLFRAKSFRLDWSSLRPRATAVRKFLPLGIRSLLTQLSIVVTMAAMNNTLVSCGALSKYGADIPMTVMGIVMKVFQVVVAVVVGIAAGAQPVVGYNYGAGRYDRVRRLYRVIVIAEVAVGLAAMLCFECFPLQIIGIFGAEEGLYNEFAVLAFRIYLSTVVLCCVQKATSIFLQALGKPLFSLGLSLLRDFILSVPLILLLGGAFGVTGPLWSGPISDVVSLAAAVVIMIPMMRRMGRGQERLPGREREGGTSAQAAV